MTLEVKLVNDAAWSEAAAGWSLALHLYTVHCKDQLHYAENKRGLEERVRVALRNASKLEPVKVQEPLVAAPRTCGGCGNSNPSNRCLGCMHDFGV